MEESLSVEFEFTSKEQAFLSTKQDNSFLANFYNPNEIMEKNPVSQEDFEHTNTQELAREWSKTW